MRTQLIPLFALTAALTAQSPLTTTFANNNGGASGGAIYFELEALDPAGLTITDIDLNLQGTGGTTATFDLYLQPLTAAGTVDPVGDWVGPVSTGSAAATSAAGTPTAFALSTPLSLGAGCRFGVAVTGDFAHAYTTGSTTVGSNYATAELELLAFGASNTPFSGPVFQPRVVNTNIYYTSGGSCPSVASATPRGDGCVEQVSSFYEQLTPSGFDLNGMKLTATNNGSGFDITLAAGAGFTVPAGAAELVGLGDDTQVDTNTFGGTLGLVAGSNCWLATGAGNSNGFSPSVSTMLGNPSTGVYSWTDLQPNAAGSGQVYYDEPSAGVGRLTYDGVYGWNTTDQNFVQITLDTNTGDFSIEWGATGAGNPEDTLVGYSVGGSSNDPGATDISAAAPFSIADADAPALALSAVGRPIQDPSAAVAYDATTDNIGGGAFMHFGLVGFANSGITLNNLGFPAGCTLYAAPALVRPKLFVPPGGGAPSSYTWTALTIPSEATLMLSGYEFTLQAVTLDLGLGSGTSRASNAVDCVVGSL